MFSTGVRHGDPAHYKRSSFWTHDDYCEQTLMGYSSSVLQVVQLRNRRIVSASDDNTLDYRPNIHACYIVCIFIYLLVLSKESNAITATINYIKIADA